MVAEVRLALATAQSAMWFAQQLDPENTTFSAAQYLDAAAGDPAQVAAAVDRALADAPELAARVAAVDGAPAQQLGAWELPPTRVLDLSGAADPDVAARVWQSFIPEMPFRVGLIGLSQVPISQHGRASRRYAALTRPTSSVDRG